MPVIFVTAEPSWFSPDGPWPLSERWPVVSPDTVSLMQYVSQMANIGNDHILVVSTDSPSHQCAAVVTSALCTPQIGHLRLRSPKTLTWLQSRAITMLPDEYLGLAESLTTHVGATCKTFAALSSVVSMNAFVPRARDVLRSVGIPGSRFWADIDAQTVRSLKDASLDESVAAIIGHGAGQWDDALSGLTLPQFTADLGRLSSADEMWKSGKWVEITVASRAPGVLVQDMQAKKLFRCRGCSARVDARGCLFCGQSLVAREMAGATR